MATINKSEFGELFGLYLDNKLGEANPHLVSLYEPLIPNFHKALLSLNKGSKPQPTSQPLPPKKKVEIEIEPMLEFFNTKLEAGLVRDPGFADFLGSLIGYHSTKGFLTELQTKALVSSFNKWIENERDEEMYDLYSPFATVELSR